VWSGRRRKSRTGTKNRKSGTDEELQHVVKTLMQTPMRQEAVKNALRDADHATAGAAAGDDIDDEN